MEVGGRVRVRRRRDENMIKMKAGLDGLNIYYYPKKKLTEAHGMCCLIPLI